MRVMQGAFSSLPDLTDAEVAAQIDYMLGRGWTVAIESTEDPRPRNIYWSMWGLPMFDVKDSAACLAEIRRCREAFPGRYVRVLGLDASHGRQTIGLSFIVHRGTTGTGS